MYITSRRNYPKNEVFPDRDDGGALVSPCVSAFSPFFPPCSTGTPLRLSSFTFTDSSCLLVTSGAGTAMVCKNRNLSPSRHTTICRGRRFLTFCTNISRCVAALFDSGSRTVPTLGVNTSLATAVAVLIPHPNRTLNGVCSCIL